MYHLAVSVGVHDNRVLDYLKNTKELRDNIDFERDVDNFGWANYTFPGMGEDQFRYIVGQLRNSGVTMDQVDTQLTEKKIMKLANLLNELAPTTEEVNKPKWLEMLKRRLREWKSTQYNDDKTRGEMYYEDMMALVEEWEKELSEDKQKGGQDKTNGMVSMAAPLSEDKLRNLIRKTIRQ